MTRRPSSRTPAPRHSELCVRNPIPRHPARVPPSLAMSDSRDSSSRTPRNDKAAVIPNSASPVIPNPPRSVSGFPCYNAQCQWMPRLSSTIASTARQRLRMAVSAKFGTRHLSISLTLGCLSGHRAFLKSGAGRGFSPVRSLTRVILTKVWISRVPLLRLHDSEASNRRASHALGQRRSRSLTVRSILSCAVRCWSMLTTRLEWPRSCTAF